MIEIAKYCCKDATEARIKEQEHYELLKASSNLIPPYVDKKKYYCFTCNIQCQSQNHYKRHIELISHKNKENTKGEQPTNAVSRISNEESIFSNDFLPKSCFKYCCINCDYRTSKKSSFDEHLTTKKHYKSMVGNKTCQKPAPNMYAKYVTKNIKIIQAYGDIKKLVKITMNNYLNTIITSQII